MPSLPRFNSKSFRTVALAALLGLCPGGVFADESPWLIMKVAGEEGTTGELYDNYLINGATTGVTSTDPGFGQRCLPGTMPIPSQHPIAPSQTHPSQVPVQPDSTMPATPPSPTDPALGQPATPPAPEMANTNNQPNVQGPNTTPPFSNNQQSFVDFNQGFGSNTLLASRDVPAMVGDFFGGGIMLYQGYGGSFQAPNVASGVQGRLKLAENTNPVPVDRLYVNYSYFNSTIIEGIDVNRVTFGAEKTFLNQMASFEIRLPTVSTLNSDIIGGGSAIDYGATGNDYQIGNLQMYLKGVLVQGQQGLISTGLGITLPTAPDTTLSFGGPGSTFFVAKNQSVHLLPFIGGVYTPNDRLFATSLLQFDIDLNGQSFDDGGLSSGHVRDQNYLFLSQGIGYWVVREPGLRIAPIAEVHYNQSLAGGQQTGPFVAPPQNVSIVNGVLGVSSVLNEQFRVTAAYVTPLGAGSADNQFDGEFRVMFNWYFGATSNSGQAGFFN